jgi:hypothetical protein
MDLRMVGTRSALQRAKDLPLFIWTAFAAFVVCATDIGFVYFDKASEQRTALSIGLRMR